MEKARILFIKTTNFTLNYGFTQSLTKILCWLCETQVILKYLGFKPERPIKA